ncbi:MAG: hypothetical protein SNJ79_08645, partial [Sphingomonadaceae bacterium]
LPAPATLEWPQLAGLTIWAVLFGGAVYAGAHLLLWQLAGRPEGAEGRILAEVGRLIGRLQPATGN